MARLRKRLRTTPTTDTPVIQTEPASEDPAALTAKSAIDAHKLVMQVLQDFCTDNQPVLAQLVELAKRAEAAETAAKQAVQAIATDEAWKYEHVSKSKSPTTPSFEIALLPPEVLLTPGVIKTVDGGQLVRLATGTLAPYAEELAAAKRPNPKKGSVTFKMKSPAHTALAKLVQS